LNKTAEDMPEGESQGTPQGGVISPLLANIYLVPLHGVIDGDLRVAGGGQHDGAGACRKCREGWVFFHEIGWESEMGTMME